MKQHKWHKEIKAWADGAVIQKRVYGLEGVWSDWYDSELFEWEDDLTEYRIKPQPKEPQCKTHPNAPHGFCRDASHSEDRYICECEFWEEPKEPQYLYVYLDYEANNGLYISRLPSLDNYIGKIKLEVEDD